MAIIGFILCFLISAYIVFVGAFALLWSKALGTKKDAPIGFVILCIGLFLGYLTITYSPFSLTLK